MGIFGGGGFSFKKFFKSVGDASLAAFGPLHGLPPIDLRDAAFKGDIRFDKEGFEAFGVQRRQLGFEFPKSQLFPENPFPDIPEPVTPPPPPKDRPRPPARETAGDEAEADTRLLFRRRGRRSTVLTPGRGAGATQQRLGTTGRR